MKAKEVRGTDKGIINEKLIELKKELVKINAQIAIGTSIKNPGQVRKIKKTLARILTLNQENKKQTRIRKSEVDKKA